MQHKSAIIYEFALILTLTDFVFTVAILAKRVTNIFTSFVSVKPNPSLAAGIRPRDRHGRRQVPVRPCGQLNSSLGREWKPREPTGLVLRYQC